MRYDSNRYNFHNILCLVLAAAALVLASGFVSPVMAGETRAPLQAVYSPGETTSLYIEAEDTATGSLDAIVAIPDGERTFENTVVAFDRVITDYEDLISPLVLMGYFSPEPETASEGMEVERLQNIFFVDIYTRSDLYDSMVSVKDLVPDTPVEQRLYDTIINEFEYNGLGLPEENLTRVREMRAELSAIERDYNINLNNDDSAIIFTKEELRGLTGEELSYLEQTPEGDYIIPLLSGDYGTVMVSADNADTRKRAYMAFNNVQGEENTALLEEAIVLRRNIAREMGYPTWADYAMTKHMADNATEVMEFLNSLKEPLSEKTEEEMAVLLGIKQEIDPAAAEVFPWDIRYLKNILLLREYDYDEGEFESYFPVDNVLDGIFSTCGELFAIEFEEVPGAEVWSPDVRLFEVTNTTDGRTLGYLYLDLYPREGKYGGYATSQVISGREINGTYSLPVAMITGTLNPPEGDVPSLLSTDEIFTLFHETGHAMHVILTTSPYGTLSGYKVAMDFCETPSQTLEEWGYDKDVLVSMSGRYDNPSEKVPEELVGQAIAVRGVNSGYEYGSQLVYSLNDMYFHTADGPVDTSLIWHDTYDEVLGPGYPEGIHPAANFQHIMGGYEAGYYGYLWSKVYALEIVDEFKENGMTNRTPGLKLRDEMYSKGNTEDGMTILENFLGREPGIESLYTFMDLDTGEKDPEYNLPYPFYDGISVL